MEFLGCAPLNGKRHAIEKCVDERCASPHHSVASFKRKHVSLMAAAYLESDTRRETVTLVTSFPPTPTEFCNSIIR